MNIKASAAPEVLRLRRNLDGARLRRSGSLGAWAPPVHRARPTPLQTRLQSTTAATPRSSGSPLQSSLQRWRACGASEPKSAATAGRLQAGARGGARPRSPGSTGSPASCWTAAARVQAPDRGARGPSRGREQVGLVVRALPFRVPVLPEAGRKRGASRSPSSASTARTRRTAPTGSLQEFPVPYPSFFDPHSDIAKVFHGDRAFPTTVFYDRKGGVEYVEAGRLRVGERTRPRHRTLRALSVANVRRDVGRERRARQGTPSSGSRSRRSARERGPGEGPHRRPGQHRCRTSKWSSPGLDPVRRVSATEAWTA